MAAKVGAIWKEEKKRRWNGSYPWDEHFDWCVSVFYDGGILNISRFDTEDQARDFARSITLRSVQSA